MGAIIGIGALLIVPKLVGVFHSGYGGTGGNYRSECWRYWRIQCVK